MFETFDHAHSSLPFLFTCSEVTQRKELASMVGYNKASTNAASEYILIPLKGFVLVLEEMHVSHPLTEAGKALHQTWCTLR